jgi:hypothetical protein
MKHWRGSCVLLLAATLPASAGGADRAPVLVELFTSEGCSSCPPADLLLENWTQRRLCWASTSPTGTNEGWRDRFSLDDLTSRQQGYARALPPG